MRIIGLLSLLLAGSALGQEQSPFKLAPAVITTNGATVLRVRFGMPPHHHLYADRLAFQWDGESAPVPGWLPEARRMLDKFSGEERMGFEHSFEGNIPLGKLPELAFPHDDEIVAAWAAGAGTPVQQPGVPPDRPASSATA